MSAGRFQIVYADPPWQYGDSGVRGGVDHHYPTMPTHEIAALPVSRLAAPDATLFLWCTWPFLGDALQVGGAWGFRYKTCAFAWVKTTSQGKDAMGLGHWTRGNTEPCLLFTRGKPKRVDAGIRQVVLDDSETIFAPRGRHSAKPPEVRERIVRLMGDVPRLEMFARERTPGWEVWGNDPGLVATTVLQRPGNPPNPDR